MHKTIVAKISALAIVSAFLAIVFFAGVFASQIAFRDPDTCWILALGKWIVDSHSLPSVDPFSSNLSSYVKVSTGPLIQYQWLIESAFYFVWTYGKEVALLLLVSTVCIFAFAVVPFLLLSAAPFSLSSILIIVFGLYATSLRFIARPEIFSSLFLGLIILLERSYVFLDRKRQVLACVSIAFFMMLWSNSHMLFPLGPIYLVLATFGRLIQLRSWQMKEVVLQMMPLLAGLVGSLLNPWGADLWIYDYRLTQSPVSFENADHQAPIFSQPYTISFLICAASAAFVLVKRLRRVALRDTLRAFLPALLAGGMFFKYAKLIPESYLLICAAVSLSALKPYWGIANTALPAESVAGDAASGDAASGAAAGDAVAGDAAGAAASDDAVTGDELGSRTPSARSSSAESTSSNSAFFREFSLAFENFGKARALGAITILILGVIGAMLGLKMFGMPSLPGETQFFKVPDKAIAYLNEHAIPGKRLLNEGLYGSVMTWRMKRCPDLFIDSRFSQFEPKLVADYESMILCKTGWEKLLADYKIDSVFIPNAAPLADKLKHDFGWKVFYSDELAVVLCRPEPNTSVRQ